MAKQTNGRKTQCIAQADCVAGNYCAWDDSCHPESHAPKRSLEFGAIQPNPAELLISGNSQTPNEPSQDLATGNTDLFYNSCATPDDCAPSGASCFDVSLPTERTNGALCSSSCSSDNECPASNGFTGACYSLSGTVAICYQRCDTNTDCLSGNENPPANAADIEASDRNSDLVIPSMPRINDLELNSFNPDFRNVLFLVSVSIQPNA